MRSKFLLSTVFLSMFIVFQIVIVERSSAVTVCEWAKENYLQNLEERSRIRDVSGIINEARKCNPPTVDIPFPKVVQIAKRGWFAEAEHILEVAEAASHYRDVTKDIGEYERIMRMADGANFIKADTAARLKKRGLLNKDNSQKNCGAVDLRPKFGPVRDQDSIGWCYAFVTADMIEFKTGIRVSASDVAAQFTVEHGTPLWKRAFSGESEISREGGDPLFAAFKMAKIGVCREQDFPSEYSGQDVDLKTFVEFVEKSSEKDRMWYLTGGRIGKSTSKKFRPDSQTCTAASAFKLSPTQLQALNEISDRSIGARAFFDLAKKSCDGKRVKIELPHSEWMYAASDKGPKDQIDFMDQKLSKNLPVSIIWDTGLAKDDRKEPTSHASIVVGRRVSPKTGLCEYLVRNSWGKSCPYPYYDCEEGHVWLPREAIHQSVNRVDSFEK